MKKITGFKKKEDKIDGSPDKANEVKIFFKRVKRTSSASSSLARSQAGAILQDPQFADWCRV